MIKVYGHPMSTCTRKVLTTLVEHGIPHEMQLVDLMTGAHKQPEHLARQPFGQIPTIDDDGFTLYESRVICRYLDEKAGGNLTPKDIQAKAVMEQWISVETSNFTPHVMKFVYHHVFQRKQDEKVLEEAAGKVKEALGVMDKHLAKNQYFAGGDFSLADISFMPYFEYAMATPVKDMILAHQNVAKWWERVSTRSSWKRVTNK